MDFIGIRNIFCKLQKSLDIENNFFYTVKKERQKKWKTEREGFLHYIVAG